MGFALTVAYIVLTIISPEQFGPKWSDYHLLLYLAGITAMTSLPSILTKSHLQSSVQTYLMVGFIMAIGMSQVANRWLGGAIQSWLVFLPSAAAYFFIVANVTTIRRLKIIVLATVVSVLILVGEALYGYYGGFLGDTFVLKTNYVRGQDVGQILRLRAVGFLNDPNDFAQMLLIAFPLIFIAWHRRRVIANALLVVLPAGVLLWATYLTHSRGALIGLAALSLMAARKKLGTVPSIALACVLAVSMLALDFTGGRGISPAEGADRMTLWATGLQLFKSAPVFGVGFGNFTDFADHTAHNSFILSLAELGLVGSTLWIALLVTTTMELNRLIAQQETPAVSSGEGKSETTTDSTFDAAESSFEDRAFDDRSEGAGTERDLVEVVRREQQPSMGNAEYERDTSADSPQFSGEWLPTAEPDLVDGAEELEIETVPESIVPRSWLTIIRLMLISLMTTSWFLSRTYATTTYLVLGLATAAIALNWRAGDARDRSRWLYTTLAVEVLSVVLIHFVVQFKP
jgi:putative inorganic carbon (HCO3(-)) transporter